MKKAVKLFKYFVENALHTSLVVFSSVLHENEGETDMDRV